MLERDRQGLVDSVGYSRGVCKDVVSGKKIASFLGRRDSSDKEYQLAFRYRVVRVVEFDPSTKPNQL